MLEAMFSMTAFLHPFDEMTPLCSYPGFLGLRMLKKPLEIIMILFCPVFSKYLFFFLDCDSRHIRTMVN